MFCLIVEEIRPKQWIKNIAVFVALLFSKSFFSPRLFLLSLGAFVYFCLISGISYILNDIYDFESDRRHPEKCKRPIASGRFQITTARIVILMVTPIVILSCMLWSWKLDTANVKKYFIDRGHLTEEGYRIEAEAICELIKKL
jgi:4-hydroxybenzoate polyprenyltransferase